MKLSIKANHFKYLILGAGGLGLALRSALYATGIDGRGLLEQGHWAQICLWILTLVTGAGLILFTRSIKAPADRDTAYPASFPAALGAFAAMAGIGVATVQGFAEFSNTVHLLVWVLGICSCVALGVIGFCRMTGRKPYFLLHAAICVYFALRMISRYQLWSSDPQLMDYCFYLLAHVALMLTAYHHAAFDADMGSHKGLWLYSLAAVYLCCLSIKNSTDALLLLCCGAWAFTNLTCLTPRRRRPRPKLELEETSDQEA